MDNMFGEALRLLRKSRGLSLRAVAAQAGITYVTLSYWETGKTLPRLPELNAVLGALEVGTEKRQSLLRLMDTALTTRQLHRVERMPVPAIGGDLLWSMRQRKGWTQADTARAVGVHQAQIARWERGEAWPDAPRLHTLCWNLDARPEEVVALTMAGTNDGGKGSGNRTNYHDLASPDHPVDTERWADYLRELLLDAPPARALVDLTLLTTEHRLSALAQRDTVASALLPAAYAVHARLHWNSGQPRQAAYYAERGMVIAQHQRSRGDLRFVTQVRSSRRAQSFWFGSVVVLANVAARSTQQSRLRYTADVLEQWLPMLPQQNDGNWAWGMSGLADVLVKMGREDEALAVSEQACNPEKSPSNPDFLYRCFERSTLLAGMGRYRQALSTLERCNPADQNSPFFRLRLRQLQDDYLHALNGQVS